MKEKLLSPQLYRLILITSIFGLIISGLGAIADFRNFYVTLMAAGLMLLAVSDIKKITALKNVANICFIFAFIWGAFLIKGLAGFLLALFALTLSVAAMYSIIKKPSA